jgi:hypothetical protein
MTTMKAIDDWLKRAIGTTLDSVLASTHVFGGQVNLKHPWAVWLQFGDLGLQGIQCAPDGCTLALDTGKPMPVQMGEYGESVVRDVGEDPPWNNLRKQRLIRVSLLRSEQDKCAIGVRLVFANDKEVVLVNWGDELEVWDHIDLEKTKGEELTEVDLSQ